MALVGATPRGNRSLFGLEVATLSQGPDCPSVQEQRSIDDEYAPAVFQVRLPAERWMGGRQRGIQLGPQRIIQPFALSNTIQFLEVLGTVVMNLVQSLPSAERPVRRWYSVTSALKGGICKGLGSQRRELVEG